MLSRRRLIEPAARLGLELPRRLDDWRRGDVAPLRGRLATKLVLLLLPVGTFGAFLFLNRGAVVETLGPGRRKLRRRSGSNGRRRLCPRAEARARLGRVTDPNRVNVIAGRPLRI